MINPRRQNLLPHQHCPSPLPPLSHISTYNQIILLQKNPHPLIALIPHIKEPRAVPDIPNLLILMQMLVEKHLDFLFVDGAHFFGGHGDEVAVLVAAFRSERVDVGFRGDVVVEDAEGGQVGLGDCAAGVVGEALVALFFISSHPLSSRGRWIPTSLLSNQYALILTDSAIEFDVKLMKGRREGELEMRERWFVNL
jgi:hypothetical protein